MFRRAVSTSLLSSRVAPSMSVAARCVYTPPADIQKLYESEFQNEKYPIALMPSDTNLFAQFLYKSQEGKGSFDTVLNDIKTVNNAKLPVFWERTQDVETIKEFSNIAPATKFTMIWMQKNGLLGSFHEVATAYETLVNAQKKKHTVKVYVGNKSQDVSGAQADAKKMQEGTIFAGFALNFETIVDPTIVSGYNVEACGKFFHNAKGAEGDAATGSSGPKDYTAVPSVSYAKTPLPENIEGEILGRYFENLAQYDAEEAKNGV